MANTAGLLPLLTPDAPGLDINASDVPKIIAVSVVLIVLSTAAVVLRFISRMLSKAGLWWDDWVIVAALVMTWGACLLMITTTQHGFGRHMAIEGSFEDRVGAANYWFKSFYAYETVYTIAITLAKYSILLFYSRIFKEHYFKIALWVTAGIVTAWFVAIELSVLLECIPIHSLWDFGPGHCINLKAFFLGSGIPNVILNAVILVLPLPMIWTLQIERSQKIALSSVFLLGGFIVIVSIVRVVILNGLEEVDITWEFVNAGLWTSVEPAIGVCSACLPIMRSLFIRRRNTSNVASPRSEAKRSVHSALSVRSTKMPDKEHRVGSFTSHMPLNELSADGELPWGNHVSIYSTSRTSDHEDIAMDDLPIQREELPGQQSEPNAKAEGFRKHKKNKSSVAELYG
ncbi:hypothetical protein MMC26_006236 [Xylographa opegraphella]|nr:hypothetical protein [Xylographa opegraphella]